MVRTPLPFPAALLRSRARPERPRGSSRKRKPPIGNAVLARLSLERVGKLKDNEMGYFALIETSGHRCTSSASLCDRFELFVDHLSAAIGGSDERQQHDLSRPRLGPALKGA